MDKAEGISHYREENERLLHTYTAYYHLDFSEVDHHLEYLQILNNTICAQFFIPINPIGSVVIIHGYSDHSAMMRNCIKTCIDMGYEVATMDLPGHGFSSGNRGEIDNFLEYAKIFDKFINYCKGCMPQPFHFIGHSTGCSVALEFMYNFSFKNNSLINKTIFLAPLVRSSLSGIIKVLYYLMNKKITCVPSFYHPTTSNPEFESFRYNDPLRFRRFPLKWLSAAMRFEKDMHKRGLLERDITILQGSADAVVDWKYNTRLLNKKLYRSDIVLFDGARHQLHNEKLDLRKLVLDTIRTVLH